MIGNKNTNIDSSYCHNLYSQYQQKNNISKILVTGGTGFIGSHVIIELLTSFPNAIVIIVDNLSNSDKSSIDNIKKITGVNDNKIKFYNIDLTSETKTFELFNLEHPDAIIHLAGYKAVGESIKEPMKYYHNNLISTMNILNAMKFFDCKIFIFSSSATVYGDAQPPFNENTQTGNGITNPYGQTKFMIELMMKDFYEANKHDKFTLVALRYFNPVGAHESGFLGENPSGIPNNLMPYILRTALQYLINHPELLDEHLNEFDRKIFRNDIKKINLKENYSKLTIFGDDYNTKDGTAERDYIHVVDLAKGHIAALQKTIDTKNISSYNVYNLGSGIPISVKLIVKEFIKKNSIPFNIILGPKRQGDLPQSYANSEKANKELNWTTTKTLSDMVVDSWKFQLKQYGLDKYINNFKCNIDYTKNKKYENFFNI